MKEKFPFIISNLIRSVTPLVVMPYCIGVLGVVSFGEIAAWYSLSLFYGFVVDLSVNVFGATELAKIADFSRSKRFLTQFFMRCAIFLVTIVPVKFAIDTFLFSSSINSVVFLLFLMTGLATVFDLTWMFLATKAFKIYLAGHVLGLILSGTAFVVDSYFFHTAIEVKIALILTSPILIINTLCAYFLFYRLRDEFNLKDIFRSALAIPIEVRLGASIFMSQIVSSLYSSTGPFYLNLLDRPDVAAVWVVINRIILGIGNFATLPAKAAIVHICEEWSKEPVILTSLVKAYLRNYIFTVSVVFILIFGFRRQFSAYLFSGEYILTFLELTFLYIWALIPIFAFIGTSFLIFLGKPREILLLTTSNLLIYLALTYPLTQGLGFSGFILCMLVSQLYLVRVIGSKMNLTR